MSLPRDDSGSIIVDSTCPHCGVEHDRAAPMTAGEPSVGYYSICADCGKPAIYRLRDDGRLAQEALHATDLEKLSPTDMKELTRAMMLWSRWRRARRDS